MPAFLTTLMTSLFGSFMDFFTRFLTRKLALGATFLAIMMGMIAIFIAALNAAIASMSYVMPDFLGDAFGLFMPSNTLLCITAIYSAQVARFIFDRNKDIVNGQIRIFS